MKNFALPGSFIFAVVLIGGAYLHAEGSPIKGLTLKSPKNENVEVLERNRPDFDVSPKRSERALVRGSVDAPVTIVEFSDLECVFCKRLHSTLSQLLEEYPDQVNWEFRHLPLVIHLNARSSALASECVGDLAGTDAFWKFTDFLFENQSKFSQSLYEQGAGEHGISAESLESCMKRQDISDLLLADEQIAMALGAGGTPYSVIVYADGSTKPVSGALPYEEWVRLINK